MTTHETKTNVVSEFSANLMGKSGVRKDHESYPKWRP